MVAKLLGHNSEVEAGRQLYARAVSRTETEMSGAGASRESIELLCAANNQIAVQLATLLRMAVQKPFYVNRNTIQEIKIRVIVHSRQANRKLRCALFAVIYGIYLRHLR